MKLAELFVEITARDNQFRAAIGRVESSVRGTSSLLKKFAGVVSAAFVGAKVLGAMHDVAGAAVDMESRMAQLRKTTGLQGEELAKLKGQITGLGETMAGVKLGDLFDIAVMGGRLGVAGDKIAGFTRDIGMIKVALDDIPAEEAATSISRILNVFGRGTEDAIRFASALNKLDDTSTATGRDILDISQRLSGPAAVLGMSPQKVLALSAALKDAGVENEVAGTAIGQVFMKMATDSKAFARVAGVSTEQFTEALRGDPLEALAALERGLKRVDKIAQFKALDQLGLDGQRTAQTLLQLGAVTGKLGGYVKAADGEWRSMASILAENAAQADTTASHLDRMRNAVQTTAARLGDFFLPVIRAAGNSIVTLSGAVRGFLERNKGAIEGFAARVTTAARRVGLAFSEWRTIAAYAVSTVREKMEQIVAVVGRVGSKAWDQMRWAGKSAMAYLKNLFSSLGEFLSDLFSQLGANLGAHIKNALNSALPKAMQGPKVDAPEVKPREGLFGDDRLFKGVEKRPAFDAAGALNNLPNRANERKGLAGLLEGKLAAAKAGREREAFLNRPDIQANLGALPGIVKGFVRPPAAPKLSPAKQRAEARKATAQAKKDAAEAARDARWRKREGVAGRFGEMAGGLAGQFGLEGAAQKAAGAAGGYAAGGLPGALSALKGLGLSDKRLAAPGGIDRAMNDADKAAKAEKDKAAGKLSTNLEKLDATVGNLIAALNGRGKFSQAGGARFA